MRKSFKSIRGQLQNLLDSGSLKPAQFEALLRMLKKLEEAIQSGKTRKIEDAINELACFLLK